MNHIWSGGVTFDPEGPMSTVPAIATAMLGYLCGRWLGTARSLLEKMSGLFAVGSIAMMLGLMWNWSFPINKSLWTSSYVLFTAGMACVILATCMWIIDYQNVKGWTMPWVVFGVNPIVAFVGSGMMARLIYTLWRVDYNGKPTSVQQVIYETGFHSWLPDRLASFEPGRAIPAPARRAMAITASAVGDHSLAALVALIDVAAERGDAGTGRNVPIRRNVSGAAGG